MQPRKAQIKRDTGETKIRLSLNIDGRGRSKIDTGIPFFDHMLTLFARHATMDLNLRCNGDVEVDHHHTVEDCGIVLGQAFVEALGDKLGDTKILELRDRVRQARGAAFDIKDFHDLILDVGSIPLTALEWHVDQSIRKEV